MVFEKKFILNDLEDFAVLHSLKLYQRVVISVLTASKFPSSLLRSLTITLFSLMRTLLLKQGNLHSF